MVIAEQYFRRKAEVPYLRKIDVKKLTYDLVNFKYIKKYSAKIVEGKEVKSYGVVRDDGKVRSFLIARNYIERYRCIKKCTKKKTLRTELKRKNDDFRLEKP